MFFQGFFSQYFIVISQFAPNFSRKVSRLYWISMVMLVDVLYDNLRRWNVWSLAEMNGWLHFKNPYSSIMG